MTITGSLCLGLSVAAALAIPGTTFAQTDSTTRQIGPPIQRITTASALSTERLGTITSVRELRDGRILLNDGTRRRLLLMDTALKVVEVVLDSLSEISNTYGTRPGALIPFRGDSMLFVDPVSYAIVVLDPEGKATRIRSIWRVQDVTYITSATGIYGVPNVDPKGRIVYRIPAQAAPPAVAPPAGVPYYPQQPDSAFVVAVDLDTRKLDTLGAVRIPKSSMSMRQSVEGGYYMESVVNPLPMTDDWALLSDGRVAFLRGLDYRIDYLNPDGTRTSSAKLPYDWQQLNDEAKQRMVDSVKNLRRRSAMMSYTSEMIAWVNQYGKGYPEGFTVPEGFTMPPGIPKTWILPPGVTLPANYIYACPLGVEPTMTPAPSPAPGAAAGVPVPPGMPGAPPGTPIPSCYPNDFSYPPGYVPPTPTLRVGSVMAPSELPDYRPPFATNSVRADMDGNLWVRTIQRRPVPGGFVYDIISPQGELVNRLQLPPGYTLVGFGRGKVVFLSMRDASGIHLARVRLR